MSFLCLRLSLVNVYVFFNATTKSLENIGVSMSR